MVAPRGKRVALLAGAAAILALAVAAAAAKDRLREQWHIWKLSSADENVRNQAIDALAAMKSVRAVPHLIRLLDESEILPMIHDVTQGVGQNRVAMDAISLAVFAIGQPALPALKEASAEFPELEDIIVVIEASQIREISTESMGHPKAQVHRNGRALAQPPRGMRAEVRRANGGALRKISWDKMPPWPPPTATPSP